MNIKSFLHNWIVRNIILAIVVVSAILLCAQIFLNFTTQHGKVIAVPDFYGMTVSEASRVARNSGVRIEVVDSIYVKRIQRGSIVRQEPKEGALVKEGRRIQLTINAMTPKKIPMPNLVGYSLRSAKAQLASIGLELGRLTYVEDMATNNVLRQIYRGREISAGRMIPSESRIDLILGLNPEDNITSVPNVIGQNSRRAVDIIQESSLNVGKIVFDRSVKNYQDSLEAVVYRQSPDHTDGSNISIGNTVTIYLTADRAKMLQSEE